MTQERINYVISEGFYVGNAVNMPFIIQAESLEELESHAKAMLEVYIQHLQELYDSGFPFEFKQEEDNTFIK